MGEKHALRKQKFVTLISNDIYLIISILVFFNNDEIKLPSTDPSCQKINPVKQCYLADSSCPNVTR